MGRTWRRPDRFDDTSEALRYLCYAERNTLPSFNEESVKEFHSPQAVPRVLSKYGVAGSRATAARATITGWFQPLCPPASQGEGWEGHGQRSSRR